MARGGLRVDLGSRGPLPKKGLQHSVRRDLSSGLLKRIDSSLDGLHQLLHRIEYKQLADGDWAICGALVLQLINRVQGQQERMAAKIAASGKSDDSLDPKTQTVEGTLLSVNENSPALPANGAGAAKEESPEKKPKAKGHGRQGASTFVNAKHFEYPLPAEALGAQCERCNFGRMTRYREKVVIRIVGQPIFSPELHHIEQARCRDCGNVIRAEPPKDTLAGVGSSYVIYDWFACAMLAVIHYFAAIPLKRLESLHRGWGIPLADANLWQVLDETDDLLLPLYKAIERHGIQKATTLLIDDTGSMVLTLAKEIRAETEALQKIGASTKDIRTGINATGVFLETPQGRVTLFFTGRHHAGEVLDRMLKHRKPEPGAQPLVKVTDGASKNFNRHHGQSLVEATCNAHAFLKFHDIKDSHPDEYAVAGEVYKAVFDFDDEAKKQGLTGEARMQFHQQHSKPLMLKLRAMCEERLGKKLVEPNSALWEPLSFIINQWPRLTRFYEKPGVPLDTNIIEQKLIIPVRYLAASFNFKTETGAEVGDRMMSLIATAHANNLEPVAYLAHCLKNHEALARDPAEFLPWSISAPLKMPGAPAG